MKKLIIVLILIFKTTFVLAQTFEPPVIIDPPNPMVGDTIRIGLITEFFPPCLLLPENNLQGDSFLFESNGNHFDLTVVTNFLPICNPLPFSPREYYELGQLVEGNYSIQTYWIDPFTALPVPNGSISTMYGNLVNFSVSKPKVIDSTSNFGLIILSILILISLIFNKKRNDFI